MKWASYNMGAAQPTDLGWPYVWADNTGTDVLCHDNYEHVTYGDVVISGDKAYDAATYNGEMAGGCHWQKNLPSWTSWEERKR